MNEEEQEKAGKKQKGKKKKKKGSLLSTIILVLIFVVGLGIFSYPTVSDWWNSFHSSKAIASYVEQVENMDARERAAMLEAAKEYNASLELGVHLSLSDEQRAVYEDMLNFSGTGVMGYIQIPNIGVNLPIYHGTDETVLQIAVGHIEGSSLPVGGDSSHCVLSGHRGLPSARLFTDLDKIVVGDIFTLTVLGETITYQVNQIHIVLPEETDDLAIEEGKDYCTLVTCTPYGVNSHRMLVRGERIDNLRGPIIVVGEANRISNFIVIPAIAVPILFIMLVIMLIVNGTRRPRKSTAEILDEFKKL